MMLSAVVLCGGRSTRMGRDKALLEMDAVPLYRVLAERMARIADPVFLAPGVPGRLGPTGYPELPDAVADAGPLAGIASALKASPHELVAVVAVDMPFASPAVFSLLSDLRVTEQAVVPVTADGSQPLHALYARAALPKMVEALRAGRYSVRALLRTMEVREAGELEWRDADPSKRFALNLNEAGDQSRLGVG